MHHSLSDKILSISDSLTLAVLVDNLCDGLLSCRFLKPAELQMPHCVATESSEWNLSVLCWGSASNDSASWKKVARFNQDACSPNQSTWCRLGHDHVSIKIEGEATYCLVGSPKRMQIALFCGKPDKDWNFSVRLVNDQKVAIQRMYALQNKAGYEICCPYCPFPLSKTTEELLIILSSRSEAWSVSPQAQVNDSCNASVSKLFLSLDFCSVRTLVAT